VEEKRISTASAGSDCSQHLILGTNPEPLVNTPMTCRPFSPSESFGLPKPLEPTAVAGFSVASGLSRPTSLTVPIDLARTPIPTIPPVDPFADNNPFDDPITSVIDNADVQVVRCSFIPTLPDELNVRSDDVVRVLHKFDDGWVVVEKVGKEDERGFIPMVFLRKSEEELKFGKTLSRSSSLEKR